MESFLPNPDFALSVVNFDPPTSWLVASSPGAPHLQSALRANLFLQLALDGLAGQLFPFMLLHGLYPVFDWGRREDSNPRGLSASAYKAAAIAAMRLRLKVCLANDRLAGRERFELSSPVLETGILDR